MTSKSDLMSVEEARREAIRRIEKVRAEGADKLNLRDLPINALPMELANCTTLRSLDLARCKNVTDLSVLANIAALESLELGGCNGVVDLSPLANLTALKSLHLMFCEGVTSLGPIAGLSGLKSFTLGPCKGTIDLGPLANLHRLEVLILNFLTLYDCKGVTDLGSLTRLRVLLLLQCANVMDLAPLANLTKINFLCISECDGVTDLGPLARLTTLNTLQISKCKGVTDLTPLSGLNAIESLELSECNGITSLKPLANLTALQSLNLSKSGSVTDLGPLARLKVIQSLDLSECHGITSLRPLANLIAIWRLDLSRCGSVTDIYPLASLPALRFLNLRRCNGIRDFRSLEQQTSLQHLFLDRCNGFKHLNNLKRLLPTLECLSLFGCDLKDADGCICGEDEGDNVILDVRAHFADLEWAPTEDTELKLFVLGNGGVGKTQMCRRLRGRQYDDKIPSTHGIKLGSFALDFDKRARPVSIRYWDFGGQEIYHGTHALFLQNHAIFVIVWTPECEDVNNKGPEAPRALAYWLDYLRATVGTDSPVLVVQSHCDLPKPNVLSRLANARDFRHLLFLNFSAKTDNGLKALQDGLRNAVRILLEVKHFLPIGAVRMIVRRRLRALKRKSKARSITKRTIHRRTFERLCDSVGKTYDTERLLHFLAQTGVVFYKPGLFKNRIILDQAWVLNGIYSIFHRQRALPFLFNNGRFDRQMLGVLVWKRHSIAEQNIFLDMMLSCGICFRTHTEEGPEPTYIAPDMLPQRSDPSVQNDLRGRLPTTPAAAVTTARFRFLHDGVLRRFLSQVGGVARDAAVYWKYGCWLWHDFTHSGILIESSFIMPNGPFAPGEIKISTWGSAALELVDELLSTLLDTTVGEIPTVETMKSQLEAEPGRTTVWADIRVTPKSPTRKRGKRGAAEVYKSVLAVLDTCLEWPTEAISGHAIHESPLLGKNLERHNLTREISLTTVLNHLKRLAIQCKVKSLIEKVPQKQKWQLRPSIKEKLGRVRLMYERWIHEAQE